MSAEHLLLTEFRVLFNELIYLTGSMTHLDTAYSTNNFSQPNHQLTESESHCRTIVSRLMCLSHVKNILNRHQSKQSRGQNPCQSDVSLSSDNKSYTSLFADVRSLTCSFAKSKQTRKQAHNLLVGRLVSSPNGFNLLLGPSKGGSIRVILLNPEPEWLHRGTLLYFPSYTVVHLTTPSQNLTYLELDGSTCFVLCSLILHDNKTSSSSKPLSIKRDSISPLSNVLAWSTKRDQRASHEGRKAFSLFDLHLLWDKTAPNILSYFNKLCVKCQKTAQQQLKLQRNHLIQVYIIYINIFVFIHSFIII